MNNRAKTLVILTPGFARDESDTTCIPTQQSFIRSLNEIFPHLTVIVLSFQYPYVDKTYEWFGNKVISLGGRNRGGLYKLLLRRRSNSALTELCRSNRVIGLLSFWYGECAFVAKKFSREHDVKHICWMWGQDAKRGNKYVTTLGLHPDELAVLSDFLQMEFEKNYGVKPQHVIPPGITKGQFSGDIGQKDIDILAVGSLIPLKQYEIFIEVVGKVKQAFPNIKAVLIGTGPERKSLQDLIVTSGLQSNVTLAGELSHPEVLRTMQQSKIFLHTSSYEGFGIVCIEALYAGAKVISFVKPMNREIENWQIAASANDMGEMAGTILKDPATVTERIIPFDISDTVKKMVSLFD